MKRIIQCILLLTLCLLLTACAKSGRGTAGVSDETKELHIAIASDLHYLSQALTDNGPLFQQVVANGDGKLMLDIEPITEAFTEQMISERPDLLILSGDLTFNGEYQSHLDLVDKLNRIEDAGIPVIVLSGNHDLRRSAVRFEGEGYEQAESIDAPEFFSLYKDFGYDEAISRDEFSGSYVYEPCSGLRILMLDTNSRAANDFPEESLPWVEQQLKQAKKDRAQVITVSHQNLLAHNKLFTFGYQMSRAEKLEAIFVKYGVLGQFSGHMHIQHAAGSEIVEVLSSPLSLVPCRYAMLSWTPQSLVYEARSVDVSSWAEKQGLTEEHLLNFTEYARDSFYDRSWRQVIDGYAASGLPEESVERLARCFAETNLAYFTGEPLDREHLSAELEFWVETAGESFQTAYLRSILEDEARNALKIELYPRESG